MAAATVPRYRTNLSKHRFTQPQLLAILCLMRYKDWTYRAEVRLAEHSELLRALRLRSVSRLHDPVSLPAAVGYSVSSATVRPGIRASW